MLRRAWVLSALIQASVLATYINPSVLDACPGYSAANVRVRKDGLSADLTLAGTPCNVFGADVNKLSLNVVYETGELHCHLFSKF